MENSADALISAEDADRAEMIALLFLLHSVPVAPSCNPMDHLPLSSNGHSMTLKKERELTSILAFLSSIKDDPTHVPAVCLIETEQPKSIHVLLAVNQAKPDDGRQFLEDAKEGFEAIFTALSYVADESIATAEQQVFHAIIKMCERRILQRLRLLKSGRNKGRQSLRDMIQGTVRIVRRLQNDDAKDATFKAAIVSFVAQARGVIELLDAWSTHQESSYVCILVEGVWCLRQTGTLQILLNGTSSRDTHTSKLTSLLNIVSKVARYREAASVLWRSARRMPVLRRMEVVLIGLPETVFRAGPIRQGSPSLASVFTRIGLSHEEQKDIPQMCHLLEHDELTLSGELSRQTRKTLKEGKIHGEVQLLYYCALKEVHLQPRVICSSKDACFLCNVFILAHGKTHTPRTHGRLYPGWRLPHLSVLPEVEDRFKHMLRNNIQSSLSTLLLLGRKTCHPDPAESTLLTLAHSRSTLMSLSAPYVDPGSSAGSMRSRSVRLIQMPPTTSTSRVAVVPASFDSAGITSQPTVAEEAGDASPDLTKSEWTNHLLNTQIHTLSDLDRQRTSAVFIGGHESRACVTPSESSTSTAQPDDGFNVRLSDGVSRRIDFHDLELFLEMEPPVTATVSIKPSLLYRHPDTVQVVDVGGLAPGEEIVVRADSETDKGKRTLHLEMQDKSGAQQSWEISWEMNC